MLQEDRNSYSSIRTLIVSHSSLYTTTVSTVPAKVYKGKAYASIKVGYEREKKWLRKKKAIIKIPESFVTEEQKQAIEENIINDILGEKDE